MRAGIYVRISRDITGKAAGVTRQEEDCRKYAEHLGWEVAEMYVDNDASATSGKPRPRYQELLRDIRAGDITAIVAWHPDRLYRRVTDLAELVDVCKQTNAQVATVNAGHVDLTSPTGRMVAGILANVAMYEVEHKSDRWSRSWQQGRELGAPVANSSRLYGYERDGSTVIPHEAVIAQEMVDRVARGDSSYSILQWLAETGATTTNGNVWRPAALKNYLLNPRIAGWSTHKGEIISKGQWEPIVDPAAWEEARAILASRTRAYVPRKHVLNGLIFCGLCGTRLVTGKSRGKNFYRCPSRPGLPGCGGVQGDLLSIDEMVETYAQRRLNDDRVRERVQELRAEPSGAQNELAALELRIRELEAQLDQPGTPVAAILRAIERARERQAELTNKIVASPRGALPAQGGPWPDDLRRRRVLIELVVKRVVLHQANPKQPRRFDPERVAIEPR